MSDLAWRADGIARASAAGGVLLEKYRKPGFVDGGIAVRRTPEPGGSAEGFAVYYDPEPDERAGEVRIRIDNLGAIAKRAPRRLPEAK